MEETWYYVEEGERRGPIERSVLEENIANGILTEEDFIWTKGFGDWKKISDIEEFQKILYSDPVPTTDDDVGEEMVAPPLFDFDNVDRDNRIFTIKIGVDRGRPATEYGPYSLNLLKRLFDESRVSGKTLVFAPGMADWQFLAELPIYQDLFEEVPPIIEEMERRDSIRKPFVARMFFHNREQLFEGTCRDISIGGMQILVCGIPLKLGEKISLNVHPDNSEYSFVASGTVVRLLEGNQGFSFRFDSISDEAKLAIDNYLIKE